jgi:hypothetical protein
MCCRRKEEELLNESGKIKQTPHGSRQQPEVPRPNLAGQLKEEGAL